SRADVQALLPLLRGGVPVWTAEQAIALIRGAGGAAVLAHPGRRVGRVPLDGAALAALTASGLDGVEVVHPSHTAAQRAASGAPPAPPRPRTRLRPPRVAPTGTAAPRSRHWAPRVPLPNRSSAYAPEPRGPRCTISIRAAVWSSKCRRRLRGSSDSPR